MKTFHWALLLVPLRLGSAAGKSDEEEDERDHADDDAGLEEDKAKAEQPDTGNFPEGWGVGAGAGGKGHGEVGDEGGDEGSQADVDDQGPFDDAANDLIAGEIFVEHENVLGWK